MGYTSPELSIENAQPVELYRFTTTAGLAWAFTNAEESLTDADSVVYTPAAVTRDQFSQSQEKNATQMVVTLPYGYDITADFATQFIDAPPEGKTSLVIQRHHLTDAGNNYIQLWSGTLISAAYNEEGAVEVLCRGIKNIFSRAGPRMLWGGNQCQHTLYDDQCTILADSRTDFNAVVTAIASDGVTITVSGLSSPLRDFVSGNMVKDNGKDNRLVVAQAGNVLTLQQPFRSDFAVNDTVDLQQGCNHSIGICETVFANEINFGGTPFTPGLNPFIEGLDKL